MSESVRGVNIGLRNVEKERTTGGKSIYGIGHDRGNSSRELVLMGSEDTGRVFCF